MRGVDLGCSEPALVDQELGQLPRLEPVLGDVGQTALIAEILDEHRVLKSPHGVIPRRGRVRERHESPQRLTRLPDEDADDGAA